MCSFCISGIIIFIATAVEVNSTLGKFICILLCYILPSVLVKFTCRYKVFLLQVEYKNNIYTMLKAV